MAEVLAALAPFEDPATAGDSGGLTAHFEGIGSGGTAANAALLAQPTAAHLAVGEVMPTISLNNPLQSTDPVSSRTIQTLRKKQTAARERRKEKAADLEATNGPRRGGRRRIAHRPAHHLGHYQGQGWERGRKGCSAGGRERDHSTRPQAPPATNNTTSSNTTVPANSDPNRWPFDPNDAWNMTGARPKIWAPRSIRFC